MADRKENKTRPRFEMDAKNFALMKRVVRENGRKYLPQYMVAFALMAVVAAMTGASAWIMKSIVNDVFVERNEALIWVVATSVFAIYAVRGLADYAQTVVMNSIGTRIVADQQRRLYRHLLSQGMDFFNSVSFGDVVARISHSTNSVRQVLDLLITSLGKDVLSLVALTVVMIMQDPVLSLFALVLMPVALIGLRKLVARIRQIGRAEHAGMAKIVARLKDSVLGIRVVKSFGMEERLTTDMDRLITETSKRSQKIANLSARSGPLMETLAGLAIASVIVYAGHSVATAERDPGSVFAFLTALLFAYGPAKSVARLNLKLETGLIGVRMIYEFLDRQSSMLDKPGAKAIAVNNGEVEFRDVTFSYGKKEALKNLSVVFPAGKVSALVGSSGAGKSTIFSMIERFYDPQKGAILVDGQDLRDVTMMSLRASIAFVTQEAFLFEGTIRDNILAGRPNATEDEIVAAAKAAHAHEFIVEQAEGYRRPVGEGGGNLSGGQRQRIAIARAMLRDAPILLLDEATSALDAASEAKVKKALDALMKGRTTIVIAHRLSTVRSADVIHVIEGGELVESGTHEELIAAEGTYAHLSSLQLMADPPAGGGKKAAGGKKAGAMPRAKGKRKMPAAAE